MYITCFFCEGFENTRRQPPVKIYCTVLGQFLSDGIWYQGPFFPHLRKPAITSFIYSKLKSCSALQPFLCPSTISLPFNHFSTFQPFIYPSTIFLPFNHLSTLQPFLYLSTISLPFNHFSTLFEKLFLPTGGVKMFRYLSLTCLWWFKNKKSP